MKLLVLIFISLSANAQYKANLIDFPFSGDSVQGGTRAELNKQVLKLLAHPKVKPLINWNETEVGSIASEVRSVPEEQTVTKTREVIEEQTVIDPLTGEESIEEVIVEESYEEVVRVMVEKIFYAHTDAFTVSIEDISGEVQAKKQKEIDRQALIDKNKSGINLTNAELNELLRLEK